MKSNDLQLILIYTARLLFKIGEIKGLSDKKKKVKQVCYHQNNITRNVKLPYLRRTRRIKKIEEHS